MLSFKEYNEKLHEAYGEYFSESFSLRMTDYGIDENYQNKQWEKIGNKKTTYFLSGKTLFRVDLILVDDFYHVKFSYKKDNEFTYEMLFDLTSSLSLFNRIIYIISDSIDNLNVSGLAFSSHPSNKKLESVYAKLVTNKSFQNIMKEKGFDFLGQEDEVYFYKKG